jgi:hypothetical protein
MGDDALVSQGSSKILPSCSATRPIFRTRSPRRMALRSIRYISIGFPLYIWGHRTAADDEHVGGALDLLAQRVEF